MKTIEDLNLMTIPQLKGIARDLGVDTPANIKKDNLVRLVYDIQQPDAVDSDEDVSDEEQAINDLEDKEVTTDEKLDEKMEIIEQYFGGVLEVSETPENAEVVFVVLDEDDKEIARGTFKELWDRVLRENTPIVSSDTFSAADYTPEDTTSLVTTGDPTAVNKALKPLTRVGLMYEVTGGCVAMQYGSKKLTTTINQPLSKVVRVAEHLCNVV